MKVVLSKNKDNFLILGVLRLIHDGVTTPKTIAERLNKDSRHISYYLKKLRNMGFIVRESRSSIAEYHITPTGVDYLTAALNKIKEEIKDKSKTNVGDVDGSPADSALASASASAVGGCRFHGFALRYRVEDPGFLDSFLPLSLSSGDQSSSRRLGLGPSSSNSSNSKGSRLDSDSGSRGSGVCRLRGGVVFRDGVWRFNGVGYTVRRLRGSRGGEWLIFYSPRRVGGDAWRLLAESSILLDRVAADLSQCLNCRLGGFSISHRPEYAFPGDPFAGVWGREAGGNVNFDGEAFIDASEGPWEVEYVSPDAAQAYLELPKRMAAFSQGMMALRQTMERVAATQYMTVQVLQQMFQVLERVASPWYIRLGRWIKTQIKIHLGKLLGRRNKSENENVGGNDGKI